MAAKKLGLKALMTAPLAGFRRKTVTVPEWGNQEVCLREPPAGAWLRIQKLVQILEGEDAAEVKRDITDEIALNLKSDATLFIEVVLDEQGNRVFSDDDLELVISIYGPVHARLLRQALELSRQDIEDAEKKSTLQA